MPKSNYLKNDGKMMHIYQITNCFYGFNYNKIVSNLKGKFIEENRYLVLYIFVLHSFSTIVKHLFIVYNLIMSSFVSL